MNFKRFSKTKDVQRITHDVRRVNNDVHHTTDPRPTHLHDLASASALAFLCVNQYSKIFASGTQNSEKNSVEKFACSQAPGIDRVLCHAYGANLLRRNS